MFELFSVCIFFVTDFLSRLSFFPAVLLGFWQQKVNNLTPLFLPQTVHKLLRRLHLMPYKDRATSLCSYGTKRKLSTALALIGKPSILLLVRRWLWKRGLHD